MSSFEIYSIVGMTVVLLCCGVAYTVLEFWRSETGAQKAATRKRNIE